MIKLKNYLALLLVIFSTYAYAQLAAPTYLGSEKYSAKGDGPTGIPTINYTIPIGITNKNRIMIITAVGERYNPTNLYNYFSNRYPDGDILNATDHWDVFINGILGSKGSWSASSNLFIEDGVQIPSKRQTQIIHSHTYKIPDGISGTVPITFGLATPKTANDEISFIVSVYENVKSVAHIPMFNIGSSTTRTAPTVPIGRAATEIMYMVNGASNQEVDLSLSTGWILDKVNKVINTTTSDSSVGVNEHNGIAHIVGHRNNIAGDPTVTVSTSGFNEGRGSLYGLMPFASPSVSGKVVTPTLSSGIGTQGDGLWMNVVDKSSNLVVAVVAVGTTGDFTIPQGKLLEDKNYDFILSKNAGVVGSSAPLVALNSGWFTVAEGLDQTTPDNSVNSIFNFTVRNANVSGFRFAIRPADPCNPVESGNVDSDGDGISDICDLDDDNDGILDILECNSPEIFANFGPATITGWNTNSATIANIPFGSNVNGILTRVNTGVTVGTGITKVNNNLSNATIYTPTGTASQSSLDEGLGNFRGLPSTTHYTTYTLTLSKPVESVTLHFLDFDFMRTRFTGNHKEQLLSGGTDVIYNSTTRELYDIDLSTYSNVTKDGFGSIKITSNNGLPFTEIKFIKFGDPNNLNPSNTGDGFKYTFSVVPACDTDGDGIPNRLDLDSDGDGCPDAIEGGAAFTTSDLVNSSMPGGNSGTGYTGTSTVPVVQNLGNTVGSTPTTIGVPTIAATGQTIGDSQNGAVNSCPVDPCAITALNPDSDGDGLADACDLDDDNDGILDSDELCKTPIFNRAYNSQSTTLTSGGIAVDVTISPVITNYNIGSHSGNASDAIDKEMSINFSYPVYLADNGVDFSLGSMDANSKFGNFFIVYEDGTRLSNLNLSLANVSPVNMVLLSTINGAAAITSQGGQANADLTLLGVDRTKRIVKMGYKVHALNGNNLTEGIHPRVQLDCDMDGDGIPNQLDLDSDGDGCPDAIEGDGTFATSQLTTALGNIATQNPNQNLGNTVDVNGVPIIAGATGQGIGNAQNAMLNDCIAFVCPSDPYAAQQTWWLPFGVKKVRIDFQSGSAVLNNPATGFLGQGTMDGLEGNTSVTHPITGELLFVTDGNKVYKGSTGVAASGLVGGHDSAGEAAAVIPDPQGVKGRDFLIFGNSTFNTSGTLKSAKYNLETNTLSNISDLLPTNSIYEALEVIPHSNGDDYWILVNTTDQQVKSYLYSKTSGFTGAPVSSISVPNFPTAPTWDLGMRSFISWDPRTPGKILIARHNKVGLANFNPTTGALSIWDVKITVSTGSTTDPDYKAGYSAALSPNGKYIYYRKGDAVMYYDLNTNTSNQAGAIDSSSYGLIHGLKVAKDGRLYISTGFSLFYLLDANNPITSTTMPATFSIGGSSVAYQLPNNVYWGCIPCESGTVAPALASTNIITNPATVGDLIALLSASNQPTGTVVTIHSGSTATTVNKLVNSTAIVAGTTYYAAFYDGLAICYSPTTPVTIASSVCFKPGILDAGNTYPTKHGITALGRAGAENENWPMTRQSAWTVLESKEKGFVVNRVTSTANLANITNPIEGMMVYDEQADCLKIYTLKSGDTVMAWHCFITPACPD